MKRQCTEEELLQDLSRMCSKSLIHKPGWIIPSVIVLPTLAVTEGEQQAGLTNRVGIILETNSSIYDMASRVNFIQDVFVSSLITVDYGTGMVLLIC